MQKIPLFIQMPTSASAGRALETLRESELLDIRFATFDTAFLTGLFSSRPCLCLFSITDVKTGREACNILHQFQELRKARGETKRETSIRMVFLVESRDIPIQRWQPIGVSEFIFTPISPKALLYKLAKHHEIATQLEAEEPMNQKFYNWKGAKVRAKVVEEVTLMKQDSPKPNHYSYQLSTQPPANKSKPNQMKEVQFLATCDDIQPREGDWKNESHEAVEAQKTWAWVPKEQKQNPSVPRYKFTGRKPEFSTKHGAWSFSGDPVQLLKIDQDNVSEVIAYGKSFPEKIEFKKFDGIVIQKSRIRILEVIPESEQPEVPQPQSRKNDGELSKQAAPAHQPEKEVSYSGTQDKPKRDPVEPTEPTQKVKKNNPNEQPNRPQPQQKSDYRTISGTGSTQPAHPKSQSGAQSPQLQKPENTTLKSEAPKEQDTPVDGSQITHSQPASQNDRNKMTASANIPQSQSELVGSSAARPTKPASAKEETQWRHTTPTPTSSENSITFSKQNAADENSIKFKAAIAQKKAEAERLKNKKIEPSKSEVTFKADSKILDSDEKFNKEQNTKSKSDLQQFSAENVSPSGQTRFSNSETEDKDGKRFEKDNASDEEVALIKASEEIETNFSIHNLEESLRRKRKEGEAEEQIDSGDVEGSDDQGNSSVSSKNESETPASGANADSEAEANPEEASTVLHKSELNAVDSAKNTGWLSRMFETITNLFK